MKTKSNKAIISLIVFLLLVEILDIYTFFHYGNPKNEINPIYLKTKNNLVFFLKLILPFLFLVLLFLLRKSKNNYLYNLIFYGLFIVCFTRILASFSNIKHLPLITNPKISYFIYFILPFILFILVFNILYFINKKYKL